MAQRIANYPGVKNIPFLPRRKILLVDDDVWDLKYYASVLERQGFEVRTANSYKEADHCLDCGRYDFVVVNQGTRAFEGRSLLEHVLAIDRHIPVLVLTRCVDMNCYLEAMQMGAVDYLEKPLKPAELARVVETHLPPQTFVA